MRDQRNTNNEEIHTKIFAKEMYYHVGNYIIYILNDTKC